MYFKILLNIIKVLYFFLKYDFILLKLLKGLSITGISHSKIQISIHKKLFYRVKYQSQNQIYMIYKFFLIYQKIENN
jgi:hypothetical protein